MSYSYNDYNDNRAKKRKTFHQDGNSSSSYPPSYLDTSKPSARFNATPGGRPWTLSIAVPTSIIADLKTGEQRIRLPGQIGRALAVFSIDEVVVFDDRPVPSRPARQVDTERDGGYTGDVDPAHFLAHVLSYLEAPPFMRRTLFPIHRNLQLAGHLPSLDMPHHPNPRDLLPYREGVTIEGMTRSGGAGSVVDVGAKDMIDIDVELPPKTRVTLHFPAGEDGPAEPVAPDAPRTEDGYYWGYAIRKANALSAVFTECPFEGGYDLSIGTSERGTSVSNTFPSYETLDFKHLMVVFGGPRGIEFAAMNDPELSEMGIQGRKTKELFDHWVNVLPNQGSRTIRTEEALFIALTGLKRLWDSS